MEAWGAAGYFEDTLGIRRAVQTVWTGPYERHQHSLTTMNREYGDSRLWSTVYP